MTREEIYSGVRELQNSLPWTELWNDNYKQNPIPYKDFVHILLNMQQLLGKLSLLAERADHYDKDYSESIENPDNRKIIEQALAHLFMAVLRAALVSPHGPIDITNYIEREIVRRK